MSYAEIYMYLYIKLNELLVTLRLDLAGFFVVNTVQRTRQLHQLKHEMDSITV